jgi:eukaryotic-like serine/threonine-protein kinase
MEDDPLKPGGALEGRLFEGFLRRLSETREPEPGDRIGAWRIVCELGRGGSGVVFMAERADGAFSQQVALKWLRGDRPVPGGREALARERELLASLDHPHIARLIDGGQTDDGMLWFAMDLAEGETVDRHAANLALRDRLALVAKLCRAVHHAHRRGLIHGDIKPSNVLVDGRGEPRLVDFGISRMKGGGLGSSYGLTPDYASPEQRAGDPLTTASDIWQLGHLLADLLADEVLATDLQSIIDAGDGPIARPTLCVGLGHGHRYRRLAVRPAGARPRWRTGLRPGTCWVRRNRALSLVTATAVLVLVGGGAWMALQLAEERDLAQREAARAQAALADTQAALARAEALR